MRRSKKQISSAKATRHFLNSAKTERESVEYAVAAAEKHGFVPFDPKHKYAAGDKVYYNNRGKAICLAVMGKEGCKTAFALPQHTSITRVST